MGIIKVGFLLFMIIFQAHESTGYRISRSLDISSIHPPGEENSPNIAYRKKFSILSSLTPPTGSAVPPAVASQPRASAPISQPFEGFLPSTAPSPPSVVPSLNSPPLPQVIQGVEPSMAPSNPIGVPSAESKPAPEPLQGLVPSVPPIPPDVPTDYIAPTKKFVQGVVPSTPLSGPVVLPPDKSEPVPRPLQGIVPSSPPIPPDVSTDYIAPIKQFFQEVVPSTPPNGPVAVPPDKSEPVPRPLQGIVPSSPPISPVDVPFNNSSLSPMSVEGNVSSTPPSQVVVPSNESELAPQTLQELVPATSPRPPVFVPSEKSAPISEVVQGIVPSMPPDPPTFLLPNKSSPLPQIVPGIVPSLSPTSPVDVASNKSAPMPLVVPEVPSVTPVPPISVPADKSAPPPQLVIEIVPSMPPNPPATVPSNTSAPTPRVAPIIVGSMPPVPPISVPSNKSAPPSQVVPGNVPSMPPNPPITVPSNKSAGSPRVAPVIVPSVPPTPTVSVPSGTSPPLPQVVPGVVPSMAPSSPITIPTNKSAQPPQVVHGIVPSISPSHSIVVPSHKVAPKQQVPKGIVPSMPPSVPSHGISPDNGMPTKIPLAPAPVGSPPNIILSKPPAMHPTMPRVAPAVAPPVESPPGEHTRNPPAAHPTLPKISPSSVSEPVASPLSTPPSSIKNKTRVSPVASPPLANHSPPAKASPPRKSMRPSDNAPAPSKLSPRPPKSSQVHSPASRPAHSFQKYHYSRRSARTPAPAPSFLFPPPTSNHQGPATSPPTSPSPIAPPQKRTRRHRQYPPPTNQAPAVSPVEPPFPSTIRHHSPEASPLSPARSEPSLRPSLPPKSSPSGSLSRKPKAPLPPPIIQALPPPPPNQELAEEIATGVFMKLSQVRIMGANADGQQLDETVVLIDLVPLGERFDNTTAFLTFEKFWRKQVPIKATLFGYYEVLYVRYPGLPQPPPSAPFTTLDDGSVHGSHGRAIHPFGVDVSKKRGRIGGSLIAIIILSSSIAIALCFRIVWLLVLRCRNHTRQIPETAPPLLMPSLSKPSAGTAGSMVFGSGTSSASMSFASSINTYAGSAKTYSAAEIEKATNNFHDTRILGEGGFGRVYRGILDDGTNVAVKVLKRDDQQGGREFLAEVEMLGRLHHRNLVKLIGICIEEKARCLVYELIANGSVESHLHGPDKEIAPLDWGSRIKIALGAARGLAYLHEDSSPHVIHRDFKSSNILLEHDFSPKVSDFGLARTALEEGDQHITTRVMGTFGYVAPEYAMTGHLLVKSDVYSYGVVLLELLTGRKPVDMSQPQGRENLVSWARPFLTSKEGLEMIIDPSLGSNVPFDSVGKVAAIASMCVQPEVTHRPFMGEVVQALKLVCNECDESKAGGSESCGQEDASVADMETRTSSDSSQIPDSSSRARYSLPDYSPSPDAHSGLSLSASDVFSSARVGRRESGSFRRYSSSGPLRTGRSRQFWERVRGLSRGTVSEHGVAFRL
ncbi:proline-rich receptor-like protein kinase PERK10 isoform X3 [Papaver somniferum]|uniref:proline-rich receptor-like protein kinase PERK10 isoform X3 n=1 Tax=Papaver somniferum TaxID=3469 RepID=UPI000E700693|nr:proline-rich receptor-like protein kinase PERK10 isoform X3 [Papaver somniferum]